MTHCYDLQMSTRPPSSQNPGVQNIRSAESHAGQRLDNFLLHQLKGAPRSLIYRVIRRGEVRVNGQRAKPLRKLMLDDLIRIPPVRLPPAQALATPSVQMGADLRARILFEDDGLLVIDKPSHMAVHGGSGVRLGLIEALRQLAPNYAEVSLVHRLDRETSGCVMIAKKRSVLRALHAQLRAHEITKQYDCMAHGQWPSDTAMVKVPLLKRVDGSGEWRVVASDSPQAQYASTRFVCEQYWPDSHMSWLKAWPKTGRTHQIRVHALSQGCALVGDEKYADKEDLKQAKHQGVRRMLLHASRLQFLHPLSGLQMDIQAPLPADFQQCLKQLAEVSDQHE
jgi:23S rRNA pseudouridine955/2504/2580 synthase